MLFIFSVDLYIFSVFIICLGGDFSSLLVSMTQRNSKLDEMYSKLDEILANCNVLAIQKQIIANGVIYSTFWALIL